MSTPELIRSPSISESSITDSIINATPTDVVPNSASSHGAHSRTPSIRSFREIAQASAPGSRPSSRASASRTPSRLSTPVSHYDIVVSPATDIGARQYERDIYSRPESRVSMASNYSPIPAPRYRTTLESQGMLAPRDRPESRMSRPKTPLTRLGTLSGPSVDGVRESQLLGRSESRADVRPETRLSRTSVSHLKQAHTALPSPPTSDRHASRSSRSSVTEG